MLHKLGGARYDVHIVHNDVVHAFALPGGSIVVTDAFLRSASRPEQVSGFWRMNWSTFNGATCWRACFATRCLRACGALTVGDYAGLLVVDHFATRIAVLQGIADVPKSAPALDAAQFESLQHGCD